MAQLCSKKDSIVIELYLDDTCTFAIFVYLIKSNLINMSKSKELFMSVRERDAHADGESVLKDTNAEELLLLHAEELLSLHYAFEGRQSTINLIHSVFEDFGEIFSPVGSDSTFKSSDEKGSL